MSHVLLLEGSIFDNGAYVEDAPDVIRQVRQLLSQGSKATLKAIGGSTTQDVRAQLRYLPLDATHLIVSAGGNDALGSSDRRYAVPSCLFSSPGSVVGVWQA